MRARENDPDGEGSRVLFMDVNAYISTYLSWSFRTSYLCLFFVYALFYFGFILVFSGIFFGIASSYPQCFNSGGSMIGSVDGHRIFGDLFQLSWTTFSTVVRVAQELIALMCSSCIILILKTPVLSSRATE